MKHELEADAACLERALREGWPRERAELQALLRRRPEWAALLDGPEGALDLTAAPDEQDRRLAAEWLALARGRSPRASRGGYRRPRHLAWGLAAAAVLAILAGAALWPRGTASVQPEPVVSLGSDEDGSEGDEQVVLEAPTGRVERVESFQWTSPRDLAPGESYLLILRELRGDGTPGAEILRRKLTEPWWLPDALDLADLPLRMHWSVRRVSVGGAHGPSAESWVERSSP